MNPGIPLSAYQEFTCPSARTFLSAHRDYEVSVVSEPQVQRRKEGRSGLRRAGILEGQLGPGVGAVVIGPGIPEDLAPRLESPACTLRIGKHRRVGVLHAYKEKPVTRRRVLEGLAGVIWQILAIIINKPKAPYPAA